MLGPTLPPAHRSSPERAAIAIDDRPLSVEARALPLFHRFDSQEWLLRSDQLDRDVPIDPSQPMLYLPEGKLQCRNSTVSVIRDLHELPEQFTSRDLLGWSPYEEDRTLPHSHFDRWIAQAQRLESEQSSTLRLAHSLLLLSKDAGDFRGPTQPPGTIQAFTFTGAPVAVSPERLIPLCSFIRQFFLYQGWENTSGWLALGESNAFVPAHSERTMQLRSTEGDALAATVRFGRYSEGLQGRTGRYLQVLDSCPGQPAITWPVSGFFDLTWEQALFSLVRNSRCTQAERSGL